MSNVIEELTAKARSGNVRACLDLGRRLYAGEGVRRDVRSAEALYYAVEVSRDAQAVRRLAAMYYDGDHVPEDAETSARLFERAASMGDRMSQAFIAEMYRSGTGVERSEAKAEEWAAVARRRGTA